MRALFVAIFLVPFIFLAFKVNWSLTVTLEEFLRFFSLSFLQATLSTLCITLIGLCVSLGFISLRNGWIKKLIISFAVFPAFSPVLFIVVSYQSWLEVFGLIHYEGILSVVALHSLMNIGFAGSLFYLIFEKGLKSQAQLAFIEGAGRVQIIINLIRAKAKQFSFVIISFFGLCFTSFAIPMIVGGESGATLEILAYRKLLEAGDLSAAFVVMLLQWVFFFLLIRPFASEVKSFFGTMGELPKGLGWLSPLVLIPMILLFCFGGIFFGFSEGLSQFRDLLSGPFRLLPLWVNGLSTSLMAALLGATLYLCLSYFWVDRKLHKFILGFGAVSSVLLGLAVYAMPLPMGLKLSMGLGILFFPIAYRVFGAPRLIELTEQVEVANCMGSSRKLTFTNIILPQVLPSAIRIAGLIAFWAIGDYAFSSVVTGDLFTLSLLAKSFMLGYRIELAIVLSWIVLLSGGILFLVFLWGADVCHRKLEM